MWCCKPCSSPCSDGCRVSCFHPSNPGCDTYLTSSLSPHTSTRHGVPSSTCASLVLAPFGGVVSLFVCWENCLASHCQVALFPRDHAFPCQWKSKWIGIQFSAKDIYIYIYIYIIMQNISPGSALAFLLHQAKCQLGTFPNVW